MRPALARFFVGTYMLLKERVAEEEGNVVFGLAKPLTDNLVFYGYSSASPHPSPIRSCIPCVSLSGCLPSF